MLGPAMTTLVLRVRACGAALLLLAAPLLVAAGVHVVRRDLGRLVHGVPVGAEVVRSEVDEVPPGRAGDAPRFRPRVLVSYDWEGARVVADGWPDATASRHREHAERDLADLPVGASVTVWVDPARFDAGALRRGLGWGDLFILALFALTPWFAADSLASNLAALRRARRLEPGRAALDPAPLERERALGPRLGCGTLLVLLVAAGASFYLGRVHPLLAVAPAAALVALAVVPATRILAAARHDARWRRARLGRRGGTDVAVLLGAPRSVELRLELWREEREPQAASQAGDDAGWRPAAVIATRPLDLSRDADGVTFAAPAAPFGPLEPHAAFGRWRGDAPVVVQGVERRAQAVVVGDAGGARAAFAWPPGEAVEAPEDLRDRPPAAPWRPLVRLTGRPLTAAALAVALAAASTLAVSPRSGVAVALTMLAANLAAAACSERLARRESRALLRALLVAAPALRRGEALERGGHRLTLETTLTRVRSVYAFPGLVTEAWSALHQAAPREGWSVRALVHAWWSGWFGLGAPGRWARARDEQRRGGQRVRVADLLDHIEADDDPAAAIEDVIDRAVTTPPRSS